jgi:hypothetical protein
VIFKDEDVMPGGINVGPVFIIDGENAEKVDEGSWKTQAEAEAIAKRNGVTLEVE